MTIASEITRINNNIADAYTAASGKGATLPATQNSANLATCIGSITTGGGGGGGGDVTLTRFKDDTNTEIGTYYCNFTDANNTTYKVILLDAVYRSDSAQWCDDISASVTNMPQYQDLLTTNVWESKETATQNTQLILDYCTTNNYTSAACNHCRSKSFTVDGTTYYGQLPNIIEVMEIARNYNSFDAMDTTASSYTSTNFSTASRLIWSSLQSYYMNAWCLSNIGRIETYRKTTNNILTCPVLEIPLS